MVTQEDWGRKRGEGVKVCSVEDPWGVADLPPLTPTSGPHTDQVTP